jgi:amino acid transporter
MPNGFSGVMSAVAGVFFAYIGFDAVSVLAEESKNPQRDLPRGMIYSLVICTVVYILLSLVLTGAVNYKISMVLAIRWHLFLKVKISILDGCNCWFQFVL